MFTLSNANRNCLQLEINGWDASVPHHTVERELERDYSPVLVEYQYDFTVCRPTVLLDSLETGICFQPTTNMNGRMVGWMAAPDPWSGNFSHPMALLLHPLPNRPSPPPQWSGVKWSMEYRWCPARMSCQGSNHWLPRVMNIGWTELEWAERKGTN